MSAREPQSALKRLRYRGESLIVRLLAAVIAAVPRSLAHLMVDFFGGLAAYVYRPGRRVALTELETALTYRSSSERRSLGRQSNHHFARAQADLISRPRVTPKYVSELVDASDV